MVHLSLLREEHDRDALVIRIPEDNFPNVRAVSWAIRGGGFTSPHVIVNHSIREGEWIENVDTYADAFIQYKKLPAESIMMLTSVCQQFQASADECFSDLAVRAYATVGLGNALAAGDPVAEYPRFGTINLIVITTATMTDEAMLESMAIVTEAKARFLAERRIRSTMSAAIATGTGTDCVAIISLGVGEKIRYAGKHTKLGELTARAVMRAMGDGLRRRFVAASSRVRA